MTLSQIRSQILYLKRRLARQLALQRISEEYCLEWSCSQADHEPQPDPHSLVRRVVSAGYLLSTWSAAMRYLGGCRRQDQGPLPERLLQAFLPWATPYPFDLPAT